jgi:YtkA-like
MLSKTGHRSEDWPFDCAKASRLAARLPRPGDAGSRALCCGMFRRSAAAIASLAFMACSAGCGGSGEETPAADASGSVSCSADPRLDAYSGELDKAGELGVLSFRFFDLDPAPPAKGLNTFHVEVTGAGADVTPGQLRVDLRMPDHGHGTSVEPIVGADAAPGTYTVRQLFLFMPGVWRLEFEALATPDAGAAMLDSVALHFCVEG